MTNKTIFALTLMRCGLSQPEAALLFGVSPLTVKSWAQGRRKIPHKIWAELRDYAKKINLTAAQLLDNLPPSAKGRKLAISMNNQTSFALISIAEMVLQLPDEVEIIEKEQEDTRH